MKRAEDEERLEKIIKKKYKHAVGDSRGQISEGRVIDQR
jgi:hypothetical protein